MDEAFIFPGLLHNFSATPFDRRVADQGGSGGEGLVVRQLAFSNVKNEHS